MGYITPNGNPEKGYLQSYFQVHIQVQRVDCGVQPNRFWEHVQKAGCTQLEHYFMRFRAVAVFAWEWPHPAR